VTLLELGVTTAVMTAAAVVGAMYWAGELERAEVRAEFRRAADLAADFRRGHRCWIAAGRTGAPAMMTALGRQVALSDPAAWEASFGPQWMAIHYTTTDNARRTALVVDGGNDDGTTVTVEIPGADPLSPGRRWMMSVREGPTTC